jgi:hypothetical protein
LKWRKVRALSKEGKGVLLALDLDLEALEVLVLEVVVRIMTISRKERKLKRGKANLIGLVMWIKKGNPVLRNL